MPSPTILGSGSRFTGSAIGASAVPSTITSKIKTKTKKSTTTRTTGNTSTSSRTGTGIHSYSRDNNRVDKSPFFAPSTPTRVISITETPGGSKRSISIKETVKENKSSILGATANLINAIVGSGIVGIPFAIQQAGLVTGVILVCLCAVLTDKSLRLLVETAKHADAPSYETTMEAAFGKIGFLFVCINMFIMSYGAMLSYLMIVKDTLPFVLGIEEIGMRRALLFVISLSVILPLSAQRDMANLAMTSRISVCLDIIMVALVAYMAPMSETLESHGGSWWNVLQSSTFRVDTVFVGLGVLSFAFVCQHSAFIIAGSLERPTQQRWSAVTFRGLWLCACLATLCGVSGYLGYTESTQGNILNNFPKEGFLPNTARGLLGITMLFVFPMELFVARHVCVVTFFQGRRAHEGDDATILNRRDRRITLTVLLYIAAMIPAMLFQNLGSVLSVTGAIGGSCLSYIGPGVVYLGVHGAEFVKLVHEFWNINTTEATTTMTRRRITAVSNDDERQPLQSSNPLSVEEGQGTTTTTTQSAPVTAVEHQPDGSTLNRIGKTILWYVLGMPLWYRVAQVGAKSFGAYQTDLISKSPHPSRLGHVKHQHRHSQQQQQLHRVATKPMVRVGSGSQLPPFRGAAAAAAAHSNIKTTGDGPHIAVILPPTKPLPASFSKPTTKTTTATMTQEDLQQQKQEDEEEEDDSQLTPTVMDFVIAIGFCLFGVVALCAGLLSIFVAETTRRR